MRPEAVNPGGILFLVYTQSRPSSLLSWSTGMDYVERTVLRLSPQGDTLPHLHPVSSLISWSTGMDYGKRTGVLRLSPQGDTLPHLHPVSSLISWSTGMDYGKRTGVLRLSTPGGHPSSSTSSLVPLPSSLGLQVWTTVTGQVSRGSQPQGDTRGLQCFKLNGNHTENDRYWQKNNFILFAKCLKMYSFFRICILRLQKVLL
jgi:hypothetical protein